MKPDAACPPHLVVDGDVNDRRGEDIHELIATQVISTSSSSSSSLLLHLLLLHFHRAVHDGTVVGLLLGPVMSCHAHNYYYLHATKSSHSVCVHACMLQSVSQLVRQAGRQADKVVTCVLLLVSAVNLFSW